MIKPDYISPDGTVTLYRADCADVLMRTYCCDGIDVVITDPPYGLNLGTLRDDTPLHREGYESYVDTIENFESNVVPVIEWCLRRCESVAVFAAGQGLEKLPPAKAIGGIFCPAGVGKTSWGFTTFMPIALYGKSHNTTFGCRATTLQSTATVEPNGHPVPKPIEWMTWLVSLASRPGQLVCDPFMGSCTTGVACVKLGRRFIGIEIDKGYFDIAVKRVEQAFQDQALFVPRPVEVQTEMFGADHA